MPFSCGSMNSVAPSESNSSPASSLPTEREDHKLVLLENRPLDVSRHHLRVCRFLGRRQHDLRQQSATATHPGNPFALPRHSHSPAHPLCRRRHPGQIARRHPVSLVGAPHAHSPDQLHPVALFIRLHQRIRSQTQKRQTPKIRKRFLEYLISSHQQNKPAKHTAAFCRNSLRFISGGCTRKAAALQQQQVNSDPAFLAP
jgi:hypothetical protein